ncbi:MAG: membrane dipeptidase, partial [Thermoanaerobaculales bacterium]|nr:membrane dipeptidase [Thermoanaerobaculales bacterium]
ANAGGIDTVALGTDFDGFTDPPDDLDDPSKMPLLTQALLSAGLSEPEVEKVLGRNMERVLRAGWR